MENIPPGEAETRTVRRRRRFVRSILLFAVMVVLTVGASVLFRRSSSLKWYVSPPIDSHGHRVHVLVPADWKISSESHEHSDTRLWVAMWPKPANRDTKLTETWLQKLHLMSVDEPDEGMIVEVDRDVCREWSTHLRAAFTANGRVNTLNAQNSGIDYMARAIGIPGTDKQAIVVYQFFEPQRSRKTTASDICNSMYVE